MGISIYLFILWIYLFIYSFYSGCLMLMCGIFGDYHKLLNNRYVYVQLYNVKLFFNISTHIYVITIIVMRRKRIPLNNKWFCSLENENFSFFIQLASIKWVICFCSFVPVCLCFCLHSHWVTFRFFFLVYWHSSYILKMKFILFIK